MHLIDVSSLELKSFVACPTNEYAILSHTWEDEELDFDMFKSGKGRHSKGFQKVACCCQQANKDGYKYVWVDTCCIDKSSSTELSEAINSMYAWYKNAGVCYAYLVDVDTIAPDGFNEIGHSRWSKRGWTLQELIAPTTVLFYTTTWDYIGDRKRLAPFLEAFTGIDQAVLKSERDIMSYSVAERMSWAASRTTTRAEDIAYCLLGLFSVNMPLLYGEGDTAFLRLQEAIIEIVDDESIFAWKGVDPSGCGLLAKHPANFKDGRHIHASPGQWTRPLFQKTRQGIEIELDLWPVSMNLYSTPLQCKLVKPETEPQQVYLYVCRSRVGHQYRRVPSSIGDLAFGELYHDWLKRKPLKRLVYVNDYVHYEPLPYNMTTRVRLRHTRTSLSQNINPILLPNQKTASDWFWNASWTLRRLFGACPPGPQILPESVFSDRGVPIARLQDGIWCVAEVGTRLLLIRLGFNILFEPVCAVVSVHKFFPYVFERKIMGLRFFDVLKSNTTTTPNVLMSETQNLLAFREAGEPYTVMTGDYLSGLSASINVTEDYSIMRFFARSALSIDITRANVVTSDDHFLWDLKVSVRRWKLGPDRRRTHKSMFWRDLSRLTLLMAYPILMIVVCFTYFAMGINWLTYNEESEWRISPFVPGFLLAFMMLVYVTLLYMGFTRANGMLRGSYNGIGVTQRPRAFEPIDRDTRLDAGRL